MEQSVKTHKRKSKNLVDPGDLVSEKSLEKVYTILGKVIYSYFFATFRLYLGCSTENLASSTHPSAASVLNQKDP